MARDRVENSGNPAYPDKIVFVDMEDGAGIVYSADSTPPFDDGDMNDNLHPNDAGYAKMATAWYNALVGIFNPSVSNVVLTASSPDNSTDDNLTCSYSLSMAADTAATAWTKDGTPIMALYMPMEGGSINALKDYSGNGNDGTLVGDPTWSSTSGFDGNGSFYFDGDGDYIDAGNVMPTGAYTKTAWYKYEPGNQFNNIISGTANHAFWVKDYSGYRLTAGHNGNWDQVKDPSLFPVGTWIFTAVTYDGSSVLRLYKNGEEVDYASGISPITSDTNALIGTYQGDCCEAKGYIDDARIYSGALSPEQIMSLYQNGRDVIVSQETSVGDVWQAQVTPFNDTSAGTTVASNDITIQDAGGPQPSFSLKINCGGPTVVDGSVTWEAGSTYVTGGSDYTFSTSSVDTTTNNIASPVPPLDVYKKCRHNSPHTYSIPSVPDGTYVVRIHWIDQVTSAGLRQIDYDIEGISVLEDWDIYAEAGGQFVAIDKEFEVTVSDGNGMQIVSSANSGDAFESAIEITSYEEEGDTTPPEISNVDANPDPQETGGYVNITCDVTDNTEVGIVKVNITYPDSSTHNETMLVGSYYYNNTYSQVGTYNYYIWAEDTNSNSDVSTGHSFTINDLSSCPDSMAHYWKLDETSGSTYEDSYAGLDGGAINAPTPIAGLIDGAQDFDGTSQYITVPDDDSLDWGSTDSFTIELWANFTNVASRNKVMIGRDQNGGAHWWLGANQNTGVVNWNMKAKDTSGGAVTGTTAINDGKWHHIVAVRNDTNDKNSLFVDGVEENYATYDYTAGFDATTSLGIGYMAYHLTPDYYYDGIIDEIALYDRALSVSEIQEHYTNGLNGKGYCEDAEETPQQVYVNVSAPDTVEQGDSFSVFIEIENVEDFDTAQYDITFDNSLLSVTVVNNGLVGGTVIPISNYLMVDSDTLRVVQNILGSPPAPGATGSGYLAEIQFNALSEGTSDLTISNGLLGDTTATEIEALWYGDTVTILANTPPTAPSVPTNSPKRRCNTRYTRRRR